MSTAAFERYVERSLSFHGLSKYALRLLQAAARKRGHEDYEQKLFCVSWAQIFALLQPENLPGNDPEFATFARQAELLLHLIEEQEKLAEAAKGYCDLAAASKLLK